MLTRDVENHEDILITTSSSSQLPMTAASPLESVSTFYIPTVSHTSSPVRIPHSFHVKNFTNSDSEEESSVNADSGSVQLITPNYSPPTVQQKSMAINPTPEMTNFSAFGFPFLSPLTQPKVFSPISPPYSYHYPMGLLPPLFDHSMLGEPFRHVSPTVFSRTGLPPSTVPNPFSFNNPTLLHSAQNYKPHDTQHSLDLRVTSHPTKNKTLTENGTHKSSPQNIPFSAVSLFKAASGTKSEEQETCEISSPPTAQGDQRLSESLCSGRAVRVHSSPQMALTESAESGLSTSNDLWNNSGSPVIGSVPQKRSNEHDCPREFTQNKVVIIQTEDAIEHFKNTLRFVETKSKGKRWNDYCNQRYSTTAPSKVPPFILNSIDTHFKHSLCDYGNETSRLHDYESRRSRHVDDESSMRKRIVRHPHSISQSPGKSNSDSELPNGVSLLDSSHDSFMDVSNQERDSLALDMKVYKCLPVSGCKPKRCWSLRYQQADLTKEDINL